MGSRRNDGKWNPGIGEGSGMIEENDIPLV